MKLFAEQVTVWSPTKIKLHWFQGIRGRMMLLTFFLMTIFFVVSHFTVFQILRYRMREVVDFELTEELAAYNQAVKAANLNSSGSLVVFSKKYFSTNDLQGFKNAKRIILISTKDGYVYSNSEAVKLKSAPNTSGIYTFTDKDGDKYRVQAGPIFLNGRRVGFIKTAETFSFINSVLATTLIFLSTSLALALVLTLFIGYMVSKRIMAPVARMADVADAINKEDLSQRINYQGATDEVFHLARTFDAMVDRLESAFTEQRQFISDASHELRTPITIIKGHLEVLKLIKDPSEQDYQEALMIVLDELDRMNRLVNNLLLLARSSISGFLIYEDIQLDIFLATIYNKANTLANRKWEISEIPEVIFRGDRDKLTEVLLNLLQNAVVHTGGPQDFIKLAATASKKWIKISVEDSGQGIPKNELKNIFNRFYRLDKARSKISGGSGLGLSIVQAIIKAHNGKVQVKSRLGQGTIFTITLPFKQAALVKKINIKD
ncbi:MAG TPA: HAMP domain-containing histidine kinase [Actinobacteria bacterium]|nr:HAMP domain-containing histidine kinase [Actinomycetes bacterium]HEX21198.1 HAMP domain-containing histidine kinase [Actinomycetota bacterium]